MRAEELMIGDLVIHGFGHNGKVTAIDTNTLTVYDKGFDDGDGHCEVTFAWNEINPISLTHEILAQNGLERICTDYYDLDVYEANDGLWRVVYSNLECSGFDESVVVSSVHELQHFLRHVGINKDIEL